MSHSHAAAEMIPLLRRMDRQFGGAWSKLDIEDRARDWARYLAVAPVPSIDATVDHLIEHHEGNYPKVAQVRRLALEHARRNNRHGPEAVSPAVDERCPSCGEMPGWHPIARPRLPDPLPFRWDPDFGRTPVLRLVTRHREDRPCKRFNAAYQFADGTEPEPVPHYPDRD